MIEVKNLGGNALSIVTNQDGAEIAADMSNIIRTVYLGLPKKEAKVFKTLVTSMLECSFEKDEKKRKEKAIKASAGIVVDEIRGKGSKKEAKDKDNDLSGEIENLIRKMFEVIDADNSEDEDND